MTTLQKTLITAVLVTTVGAGIYEAKQATNARAEVQALRQQQMPLTEQNQQLLKERDAATNRLASIAEEIAKTKSNNNELMKLRGEVGLLRQQQNEFKKSQGASLTNSKAATAVISKWLDTDSARGDLSAGLIAYTKTHNNLLPTSFADLKDNFPADSPSRFIEADKFEFLVNIPISRVAPANGGFNSGIILFRERSPRQKLRSLNSPPEEVKIYGLTTGTVVEVTAGWLKSSGYENFSDWEQKHMVSKQ